MTRFWQFIFDFCNEGYSCVLGWGMTGVVVVLVIIVGELAAVGAGTPGQRATDMLTLDRPNLDWQSIARGHGVEAGQATTLDELAVQLQRGLASSGPYLIELVF